MEQASFQVSSEGIIDGKMEGNEVTSAKLG